MSIPDAGERTSYRYKFADAEYDEASSSLSVDGQAVSIEPRPSRLLAELLHHVNEVVTKEELFESVWDGRPTVDNVFANAIAKLRKALGEKAAQRIVTVPKIGYRLDGPVERMATGRTAPTALGLQPGQAVPLREAYVLRQALGTPARGHVWLATHIKLKTQQRVFKFAADSGALRQLKREFTLHRMLQATLGKRADIAQVLDSNFNEMPYFLEYEYGGEDLLAWSKGGAAPLSAMSRAERLELFLQVARAVAAAHSAGVLHKDLKPANVLVSGSPGNWQVRLTDFGNGRALDPERLKALGLTALGMTLNHDASSEALSGTVMYLAPELLAGQVPSMQSDVYSLGILLYQLLVDDLRRPMSTGWQRELADRLLCEDIAAATDGQIQTRLGSVTELIERIAALDQRHREAEQESLRQDEAARTAALLQRTRARRPWVIGLVLSALLGLTASLWFQADARRSLARAEAESARARAINQFLNQDVLAAANVIRAGASKPTTMLDVLRQASKRAGSRFKGQPLAESAVRHQLGRVFSNLASTSDADEEFKAAIALRAAHMPASDPELLSMQFEFVNLILYMGGDTPVQNKARARATLADAERNAGPDLLNRDSEQAFLAARAHTAILSVDNEFVPALAAAKRTVALAKSLPDLDDAMRYEAVSVLAQTYIRMHEPDLARRTLQDLSADNEGLNQAGAIATARVAQMLNTEYAERHQPEAGRAALASAIAQLRQTPEPSDLHIGDLLGDIGTSYGDQGNFEQARSYYEQALESFRRALGDDHQYTRVTAANMARSLVELGRFESALRVYGENRPWFRAHATGGRWMPMEWPMARCLVELGRPAEALRMLESVPAPGAPTQLLSGIESLWQAQGWKAVALIRLGRQAEGLPLLEATVAYLDGQADTPVWNKTPLSLQLKRARAASRQSKRA